MIEWKQCTIADLGDVVTGKTPSTKITEFWDGAVHFVTPKDIQGLKHITDTERRITDEGLQKVKGSVLPPRAVCVSCIGNIGYTGMTTQRCVSNQQINSIIVNSDNDPDFVYYLMKSLWPFFKNYEGQSTTLSILNKTQFSKIAVTVPDEATQKRIAAALSALDEKIAANTQINDNLLALATALFEKAIAENAPGLVMKSIGDIADVKGGKRLPKGGNLQTVPNDHPYIRVRDLNNECVVQLSSDFEYVDAVTQKSIARYIVHTSDVIVSIVGTIGLTALVHESLDTANLTENCVKITNLKEVSPEYLLLFLRSTTGQNAIRQGTVGAVQAKLPIKNIQAITIPTIPETQRRELYPQLKTLFLAISARLSENASLMQTRDSLLPRLMSGEIDVTDIDA